jgi:hypothetical protein
MTNLKFFPGLVALFAVLGLIVAAPAGAYALPLPPGSPGGPPTKPVNLGGSNARTRAGATALGDLLAGYTAGELVNIQSFEIGVFFPSAGTIYGRIYIPGQAELGYVAQVNGETLYP